MKTAHTPGPWHAVEYGGYWEIQKEPFYSADDDLLNQEKCENAEANAQMAAKAPELFEALKELRNVDRSDGKKYLDATMKADAALLRAELKNWI